MPKIRDHINNNDATNQVDVKEFTAPDLFSDVKYICHTTSLITEALQQGFDIAQLPNGDVMVTEIKAVNIQYRWDADKQKMVKISQH